MRFWKSLLILGLMLVALPVFAQDSTQTPTAAPMPTSTPTLVAMPTTTATPIAMSAAESSDAVGEMMVDGGTIEIGATVSGVLAADAPAVEFTFEGTVDDYITLTMISDDFDCYLVLLDPEGNEIATDDDGAGDLDSLIGPIGLLTTGTYTVVAQSYSFYNGGDTGAAGDFTLQLSAFEARAIEYTQTVDSELTSDALTAAYTFRGQANDAVIVRMESDDFDSYLTLVGPDGTELIYNDDGAGNLNSLIGPFVLPETGDYVINARSLGGTDTGSYTLMLNRAQIATISYGDSTTVEITDRDTMFYVSFDGTAGDVVSVFTDSNGAVDTSLRLNDPFNYSLITDEDSGSAFDPEILNYILTSTGTHLVVLEAPYGGEGSVEITLTRGELPSLDDGAITLNFSTNRSDASARFTGVAGERVTLTLEIRGGTGSPSVDVTQDGSSVTYFSSSNVEGASFTFTTPNDGDVVMRFSEYSYSNLALEVTLERE
ncbi:MAG: hypothetical protein SGI73_16815 [Chloroflexota bacterium]|nr:hypothetical protein [Chloroflexota bacterium]